MRVEIPDFGDEELKAKSATIKLDWKEDKDGGIYLVVTASANCDSPSGGTVKSEKKVPLDVHDSPACDAIKAFKRVADIVKLAIDVEADLANEQKPLFGVPDSAH